MDDDGQRVERDGQFLDRTARLLHPDPFVELDPTRGHREVVVPSRSDDRPTPLPPPVTVTWAEGFFSE